MSLCESKVLGQPANSPRISVSYTLLRYLLFFRDLVSVLAPADGNSCQAI